MRMNFRNRKLAWKHFYPEGNGKAKPGYCLHHKDETLRHENPERYNEWNPDDLVMITSSEHGRLHRLGKHNSPKTRKKLSEINKGNTYSRGRVVSEETRRKISEAHKGRPSPFKGVPRSEETKRKMREAKRRNK